MFGKLLLPIDLSDRHQPALDTASEIAGPNGEVVLLHVIEIIQGMSLQEDDAFYQQLERTARKHLDKLVAALAAKHITSRAEIRYGNRVTEIVRFATESATDLIVVIAPKFSPKDPAASWGSMSYKVSFFSPCHVLLVK